jgi:hypothetical protein
VSKHVCPCRLKFVGVHDAQRARQFDDRVQVNVPAVSIGTTGRLYMHMPVTSCYCRSYKAPTEKPRPRISKNLMATDGGRRGYGQRQHCEAMRSGPSGNTTAHPPLKALSVFDCGLA